MKEGNGGVYLNLVCTLLSPADSLNAHTGNPSPVGICLSAAVLKHEPKTTWKGKGLFHLASHHPPGREVRQEPGRN